MRLQMKFSANSDITGNSDLTDIDRACGEAAKTNYMSTNPILLVRFS